jgi:hypothetical protein
MVLKQFLLLLACHLLLPSSLSPVSADGASLSTSTVTPLDTNEPVLPPTMGRDLLEYLMESASQARGQLPPGFLLPSSSHLNAAETHTIERSLMNHTSIEPPSLPVHQLNEQIRSMAASTSTPSTSTASSSTLSGNMAASSLSKQTKAGPDHHSSLASLANLYHKSFKPPLDTTRKAHLYPRLPPTLRSPADRSSRPSYRMPLNQALAASSASAATLEKPTIDLMKSADYSGQTTDGMEDEPLTNAPHPMHSSQQAGASSPYFMREYRTFPSFASFASSGYGPAYMTAPEVDSRHQSNYYQGHSAGHGYYADHHHEGLSAYSKSDYYWLIPVAFIIGAGALLLPIISVLMTTMVTSGSLSLSATKRRKREIDPSWQMVEQLQAWWKQFNMAMQKFDGY